MKIKELVLEVQLDVIIDDVLINLFAKFKYLNSFIQRYEGIEGNIANRLNILQNG